MNKRFVVELPNLIRIHLIRGGVEQNGYRRRRKKLRLAVKQGLFMNVQPFKCFHGGPFIFRRCSTCWANLVGLGCRIRRLYLCTGVRPRPASHNECLGYDTKQSDEEASLLEIWWMWSTPSLPLLPGPFWSEVVVPVRVQSINSSFNNSI